MCERAQKNEDGMKKKKLSLEGDREAIYARAWKSSQGPILMSARMKPLTQPLLANFDSSE